MFNFKTVSIIAENGTSYFKLSLDNFLNWHVYQYWLTLRDMQHFYRYKLVKKPWLVVRRVIQREGCRRRCWTMTWHHLATGTYFKHQEIWILRTYNSGVMIIMMKNIWQPQHLCHTHTAMCLVEARHSWFSSKFKNKDCAKI